MPTLTIKLTPETGRIRATVSRGLRPDGRMSVTGQTLKLPSPPARKTPRGIYEHPREVARSLRGTSAFGRSRQDRKRIERLFAHIKRILKMGRLRLRGPCGAHDEFLLAATAHNLRKLAKLVTSLGPQMTQGA